MDSWINKLVVSGPEAAVIAFERAAARRAPGPATSLSFANLQALLSEEDQDGLPEPVDPWDDSDTEYVVSAPDRQVRATPGCVDLIYDFSLARYEPDDLLIRVSKVFPTLSFVLGWVAPSNDEHASRFINNGHTLVHHASERQKERIRSKIFRQHGTSFEEFDARDDALWIDIEIDWGPCLTQLSSTGMHELHACWRPGLDPVLFTSPARQP